MLQRPAAQSESPLVSFSVHPTLPLIVFFFVFPPTVQYHMGISTGNAELETKKCESEGEEELLESVVQRGSSQCSIFSPCVTFYIFLCTDPSLLHSFVTSCILQTGFFPARGSHIMRLLEKVRKMLMVDRPFFICTAVNYHSFF